MNRVGVGIIADTLDEEFENENHEDKGWIRALVSDNENEMRRLITEIPSVSRRNTLLDKRLNLRP